MNTPTRSERDIVDWEYIEKVMWAAAFREAHQFFNYNDAVSSGCIADQLFAELKGY